MDGEGAPALKYSAGLSKAAAVHCADTLANKHTGSDGSSVGERVGRFGEWLTTVGENI